MTRDQEFESLIKAWRHNLKRIKDKYYDPKYDREWYNWNVAELEEVKREYAEWKRTNAK